MLQVYWATSVWPICLQPSWGMQLTLLHFSWLCCDLVLPLWAHSNVTESCSAQRWVQPVSAGVGRCRCRQEGLVGNAGADVLWGHQSEGVRIPWINALDPHSLVGHLRGMFPKIIQGSQWNGVPLLSVVTWWIWCPLWAFPFPVSFSPFPSFRFLESPPQWTTNSCIRLCFHNNLNHDNTMHN